MSLVVCGFQAICPFNSSCQIYVSKIAYSIPLNIFLNVCDTCSDMLSFIPDIGKLCIFFVSCARGFINCIDFS